MGLNPEKLKIMDSTVHMANEVSGNFGSMFASWWIGYFGWGFAPSIVPVCFMTASVCFYLVKPTKKQIKKEFELIKSESKTTG
jgi:hypothetical protein